MAKKTKKPSKSRKAKVSKPKVKKTIKVKQVKKVPALRTPFMDKIAKVTGSTVEVLGKKWPAKDTSHLDVANELINICGVLLRAALSETTPAATSSDGTMRGDVELKLKDLEWPANGDLDGLVASRKITKKTLRITEALVIIERLAQGASSHKLDGEGGGGDSTKIPPH
jgi:hypothetical protein